MTAVHLISNNADTVHIIEDGTSEVRYMLNHWFMVGCLMRTFFVRAVAMAQENFFTRLNLRLSQAAKPDDAQLAHDCCVMQ